jgi:rubrerythrin
MSDMISRDRVIALLGLDHNDYVYLDKRELAKRVEKIKGVDLDRPQGEWKRVSADKYVQHAYHFYRCSKCGYDHIGKTNYCPNCGSKMRGEHDD